MSLDDDLIAQLTGNVSATVALDGGFGVRAELKDPKAFEKTLAKVADVLPSFAEGAGFGTVGLSKPKAGRKFYALAKQDGGAVIFGVVNGVLVVANDAEARGRGGRRPAGRRAGREGFGHAQRRRRAARDPDPQPVRARSSAWATSDRSGVGLFARPLGELNGWMSASPDELRGKLTLGVE